MQVLSHQSLQGMAFLSRYRAIRGANSEDVDEVEFNFGRAFQQLGRSSCLIRPGPVNQCPYRAALFGRTPLRKSAVSCREEVPRRQSSM